MDSQARLNQAIAKAKDQVPGCLACGLVNLDIGLLIAFKTTDDHQPEILAMTAAATQDFFEGDNVKTIESMFAKARGESGDSLIEANIMITRGTQHLMVRGGRGGRHVVVFVCTKGANLGMIMAKGQPAAEAIFVVADAS